MKRTLHLLAALLVPILLLVACGATATPSPTAVVSKPTPRPGTAAPTKPVSPATAAPTTASSPSGAALDLVILHTNDVKGYLEPCG